MTQSRALALESPVLQLCPLEVHWHDYSVIPFLIKSPRLVAGWIPTVFEKDADLYSVPYWNSRAPWKSHQALESEWASSDFRQVS